MQDQHWTSIPPRPHWHPTCASTTGTKTRKQYPFCPTSVSISVLTKHGEDATRGHWCSDACHVAATYTSCPPSAGFFMWTWCPMVTTRMDGVSIARVWCTCIDNYPLCLLLSLLVCHLTNEPLNLLTMQCTLWNPDKIHVRVKIDAIKNISTGCSRCMYF